MEILEFYREILQISDQCLINLIASTTSKVKLKKGELFICEGDHEKYISFLITGILRGFFLNADGNEITDCFAFKLGQPAVSCFALEGPSPIYIEALEESELVVIPPPVVVELMKTHVELLLLYNRMLREALQTHWEVKTAILQKTATERYLWFIREYPKLIDQIPNKYIASFLGMTTVTLSRIRTSLKERICRRGKDGMEVLF